MFLGSIADDITGATDLANTLVAGGFRVVQCLGVPPAESPAPEADAVVVALQTRSIPAARAVELSLAALRWLREQGARRIFFKYCSTFDSTPEGNIGPVAGALLDALDAPLAIACPAFPENGRTVYQGHLFVGTRLLSESGMEHHPVTPMSDPDLVRVLQRQTPLPVGLLPLGVVRRGPDAVAAHLSALRGQGTRLVVADAIDDADLRLLAEALADHQLLTGGSGLAIGLGCAWRKRNLIPPPCPAPALPAVAGASAVIAGSCSAMTLRQVEHVRRIWPTLPLDSARIAAGEPVADEALAWAAPLLCGGPILIYSSASPEARARVEQRLGHAVSGRQIEEVLAQVARGLVEAGVRRLIVAGGETAGAVTAALGIHMIRIGPQIEPGVPWTESLDPPRLALALKSGNFGGENFFYQGTGNVAMNESLLREQLVLHARSLFERGYSCGSSGNISVLVEHGLLITPTNSCLGRLDAARISKVDAEGRHVSGDPPSKEVFLHRAMYRSRPAAGAVVHLHSTFAVAVACLADTDPADALPTLTPYSVMRLGKVPLVPYYPPGDSALAEAVGAAARDAQALLLANHGPVVSGRDLDAAVYAAEELEECARLSILLMGSKTRPLTPEQVALLTSRFRS